MTYPLQLIPTHSKFQYHSTKDLRRKRYNFDVAVTAVTVTERVDKYYLPLSGVESGISEDHRNLRFKANYINPKNFNQEVFFKSLFIFILQYPNFPIVSSQKAGNIQDSLASLTGDKPFPTFSRPRFSASQ